MAPRRRRWRRAATALVAFLALFFAVYTGVYLTWNDAALARTVSGWVSGSLRGNGGPRHQAFTLERAHYPYFGALRSLFFGGACAVEVEGASVYAADGEQVLHADRITTGFYVGEVVWSQVRSLVLQGDLELHFVDADIPGGSATIHPTPATGEVNLVQAFSGKKQGPPRPDGGGMVIRVDSGRFSEIDFRIAFPGWSGHVAHAHAAALALRFSSFRDENLDKERPAFRYALAPIDAPSGELVLGAFTFPLEAISVSRFEAPEEARDQLRFVGRAESLGAPATVEGRLEGTYSTHPGADLTIAFSHGRRLLALLPTGELLGGDPAGEVHIHGPFSHSIIDGTVDGGEVHLAGLTAREAGANLHLDGGRLALPAAHAALGAHGRIDGEVLVDFTRLSYEAELHARDVDPADLGPLVPAPERRLLAGRLAGGALVRGTFNPLAHPERIRVTGVAANLVRTGGRAHGPAFVPRDLAFHGDLRYHAALPAASGGARRAGDRLFLDGVRLDADGMSLAARGTVDPTTLTTSTDVTLELRRLGPLLERLGVPPLATSGQVTAHVSGRIDDPTITGGVTVNGVGLGTLTLPRVDAALGLLRGRLALHDVRGEGRLGAVAGSVELGLWHVPAPTIALHLVARHLRIHVLTDNPQIQGELSGTLDLDSPLADLRGSAEVRLPRLLLFGDEYRDGELALRFGEGDRIRIETLTLRRTAGGVLFGSGDVLAAGPFRSWGLDIDVTPRDFPLAAIGPLRALPVALGGTLSGKVHLGGDVGHWLPSGVIDALAVKVREILLGNGQLRLEPNGDAIHLSGAFWHFKVDGELRLRPALAIEVAVSFDALPVDDLLPEMRQIAEVKASVSGEARFSYAVGVGGAPAVGPRAELRLKKVVLTIGAIDEEEGGDGGHAEFRNEGDVLLTSDGQTLSFKQAHLRSLRDEAFQISGDLSPTHSSLHLVGNIQLPLLEYFAAPWFCHTHGDADAELTLTGPASRPQVTGRLDLHGAELEPRIGECRRPGAAQAPDEVHPVIFVPSGRVAFDQDGIRLVRLRTDIDGAAADANGFLGLRDWKPGALQLDLAGEVSPKVLEWLFPEHIAEADGSLGVDAHVRGDFARPTWTGAIKLRDLKFRAKRLGRDVTVTGGTVQLRGFDVTLGCPRGGGPAPDGCRTVTARIDDASELALDGKLGFRGTTLERVNVHIQGDNLEWGSPSIYSITVSPDVDLVGTDKHLDLSGKVTLVSGTFTQPFDEKDLVIRPRTVESDAPFYEGIPVLEQLGLHINAVSSGPLSIRNNISNMQVSVPLLAIGGTMSHPTLSGTITVEEGGTFKVPLLRNEFITERGQLDFKAGLDFPRETPRLDIHAYSDQADRYDQIHHVMLTVFGTYQAADIGLTTTEGWDKAQVLSLLVTGSVPDDLRKRFANDPTQPVGSGSNGVLQTGTGEVLGAVVGDPLQSFLQFDTVRIELGYVKLCKYNTRYIKLCGTGEGQITPTAHYDARLELKLSDDFSAAAAAEHIEHGIETSEDVVNRGRLQLRVKLPIF